MHLINDLYTILLHSDWFRVSKNTIFEAQKHDFLEPGGHDRVFVSMVAVPLNLIIIPRQSI